MMDGCSYDEFANVLALAFQFVSNAPWSSMYSLVLLRKRCSVACLALTSLMKCMNEQVMIYSSLAGRCAVRL